jgi:hypothetical protein
VLESTPNKRADKVTFNMRVRTVMEWILQGFMTKDIIAQCLSKWGVDERMSYKYIKAGFKEFAKLSDKEIIEQKALHVAARWKLFNELVGKNTPAGASVGLSILDRIAKIEGVLVDRVDLTSKGKELKAQTENRVIKATLKLV